MALTAEQKRARHKRYNDAPKAREARRTHAKSPRALAARPGYSLKFNHGIDLVERERLFAAQGKRCKICRTDDPGSKLGWHVDHSHASCRIRGILCHGCNAMLGFARDNSNTLAAGIAYLMSEN